jgi:hypothetical protein
MKMKPVIVVTIHRRYWELKKNLPEIKKRFPDSPVVVVWACPEYSRLWFFQELLANGDIQAVVGRPPLPNESSAATTYPESHNLRLGLERAKRDYPDAPYYVGMAADITPGLWGCEFIEQSMKDGCKATVFYWANPIHGQGGTWHTNFFAVAQDEDWWPPLSPPDDADVLERQWGRLLQGKPAVSISSNANGMMFSHRHESENMDPFPIFPQHDGSSVGFAMKGHLSWYKRLWRYVKRLVYGS